MADTEKAPQLATEQTGQRLLAAAQAIAAALTNEIPDEAVDQVVSEEW